MIVFTLLYLVQMVAAVENKKDPAENLVGAWLLENHELSGQNIADGRFFFRAEKVETVLYVRAHQCELRYGPARISAKFKIDTSAGPKKIDFEVSPGTVLRGIYAQDENVLLIAISWKPNSKRPSQFRSSDDEEISLAILRRKTQDVEVHPKMESKKSKDFK